MQDEEVMRKIAELNYESGAALSCCPFSVTHLFPYDKMPLCKMQYQQKSRSCLLSTGICTTFLLWPDMLLPQAILQIIIEYTLLYELIDEIFDHLHYFIGAGFENMVQHLWNKLVDAQLYRTHGWMPWPEPDWIRKKYFKNCSFAWKKSFDFPGVHLLTFALCVLKRLYLIRNNTHYTYFVKHTIPLLQPGCVGTYYCIKATKKTLRTKQLYELELVRLLRLYRDRVNWIEEVVLKICEEETKNMGYNTKNDKHLQRHENYPRPKFVRFPR
jgi:hypothetical protein